MWHYLLLFLVLITSCHSKSQEVKNTKDSIYYKKDYWGNGNLRSIRPYKNKVLHGEYKGYYETGKLAEKGYYNNGKSHGSDTSFYENGKLYSIAEFNHGKLININMWDIKGNHLVVNGNGTFIKHYDNGKIESKFTYRDSKLDGEYFSWFENGIQDIEFYYNKGKPIRTWIKKNKKGEIIYKENFDD